MNFKNYLSNSFIIFTCHTGTGGQGNEGEAGKDKGSEARNLWLKLRDSS